MSAPDKKVHGALSTQVLIDLARASAKDRQERLGDAYNKLLKSNGIRPMDDPYMLFGALAYELQALRARVETLEQEKLQWQTLKPN